MLKRWNWADLHTDVMCSSIEACLSIKTPTILATSFGSTPHHPIKIVGQLTLFDGCLAAMSSTSVFESFIFKDFSHIHCRTDMMHFSTLWTVIAMSCGWNNRYSCESSAWKSISAHSEKYRSSNFRDHRLDEPSHSELNHCTHSF